MAARLRRIRISQFHASVIYNGQLPFTPLASTPQAFRVAVEDAPARFPVRKFDTHRIRRAEDYAELAAIMIHTAELEVDELRVLGSPEGEVELCISSGGLLMRTTWLQRGEEVHPSFFEALDLLTMPAGRFVRVTPHSRRYVGIYLPAELAMKAEAILGGEA